MFDIWWWEILISMIKIEIIWGEIWGGLGNLCVFVDICLFYLDFWIYKSFIFCHRASLGFLHFFFNGVCKDYWEK